MQFQNLFDFDSFHFTPRLVTPRFYTAANCINTLDKTGHYGNMR